MPIYVRLIPYVVLNSNGVPADESVGSCQVYPVVNMNSPLLHSRLVIAGSIPMVGEISVNRTWAGLGVNRILHDNHYGCIVVGSPLPEVVRILPKIPDP